MKKIILFAAIAMAACVGRAEYLYWQIGDSVTSTEKFNEVALWGSNDDGATWTKIYGYDTADLTKTYMTDVSSYNTNTSSFYIEAANYENGSRTLKVDKSDSFKYSALSDYIHKSMTDVSLAAYTGATYSTVPEPTSGLMLLMGMALVALKRKRA